jgi:hypothetical protein
MTGPILSPQEIVSNLCDSGLINRAAADLLEQRIVAYAESRAAQARQEGRLEGREEGRSRRRSHQRRTPEVRRRQGPLGHPGVEKPNSRKVSLSRILLLLLRI